MEAAASSPPDVPDVRLGRDLALYAAARFGMVAVVTALLTLANVPLLVALAVSLVVVLPLTLVVFRGLRARVALGLDARLAVRRAEREKLRAQLRGEGEDPAVTS